MNEVLVLSDNPRMLQAFQKIVEEQGLNETADFTYGHSPFSKKESYGKIEKCPQEIDVKNQNEAFLEKDWSCIFSIHSKQLFPEFVVNKYRCVNVHPGLNPYNRGWYPQVFSILNKMPLGATIHEMDAKLDNGPIIVQREVPVYNWDTSETAYNRVLDMEIQLLREKLGEIITGRYHTERPKTTGNLNHKKDFNQLRELNLNEIASFYTFIDRLRALSHGSFKNAFFIDPETGRKVYVSVNLELADEQ